MSEKLTGFLITLLFLAVTYFITALLLSIPLYYSFLSFSFYKYLIPILSIILCGVAGIILGRYLTSKAFFYTLIIVIPYLLIYGIMLLSGGITFNGTSFTFVLLRSLSIILCTRLSSYINLQKPKTRH